uniref:Uncharacterized protein n=1 Tax=Chlorella vulgaris TaxID=3077 RepID=V9H0Z0_CHLVU|nr:hypothetical protein ChvulCp124 [Chlorella vulgaris]pir/T07311/ hypothetical protein 47b - Chlorella vulgaris chloroplast [Chlorella vulgaris]BAA57959.1 unnamed protein product [Chlorella vulgaris]
MPSSKEKQKIFFSFLILFFDSISFSKKKLQLKKRLLRLRKERFFSFF